MSDQKPTSTAEAAVQAAQYGGPLAPKVIVFDDGERLEICPPPQMEVFDSTEQAIEYAQYLIDVEERFDREPDILIPEQKVTDDNGNVISTLPAETKRGRVKTPYRIKGKLCTPHNVKIVEIALGPEKLARLKAGTINGHKADYSDVWRAWMGQVQEVRERADADPKSLGGDPSVEDVPEADSQ